MKLGAVEQRRTWHMHGIEAVPVEQLGLARASACFKGNSRPKSFPPICNTLLKL